MCGFLFVCILLSRFPYDITISEQMMNLVSEANSQCFSASNVQYPADIWIMNINTKISSSVHLVIIYIYDWGWSRGNCVYSLSIYANKCFFNAHKKLIIRSQRFHLDQRVPSHHCLFTWFWFLLQFIPRENIYIQVHCSISICWLIDNICYHLLHIFKYPCLRWNTLTYSMPPQL